MTSSFRLAGARLVKTRTHPVRGWQLVGGGESTEGAASVARFFGAMMYDSEKCPR